MKATLNAMFNGHFFIEEEDGGDPKGILIKLNTKCQKPQRTQMFFSEMLLNTKI